MLWAWVIKKLGTSILSRWILGGVVASLVAFAGWRWHEFKDDLVLKGQQVCIQEINKETVTRLQDALAAERLMSAQLAKEAKRVAQENARAQARRRELEIQVSSMARAMAEQEKTDETYKAWANTPLPNGVAGRLRDQVAGRDSDPR